MHHQPPSLSFPTAAKPARPAPSTNTSQFFGVAVKQLPWEGNQGSLYYQPKQGTIINRENPQKICNSRVIPGTPNNGSGMGNSMGPKGSHSWGSLKIPLIHGNGNFLRQLSLSQDSFFGVSPWKSTCCCWVCLLPSSENCCNFTKIIYRIGVSSAASLCWFPELCIVCYGGLNFWYYQSSPLYSSKFKHK